MALQNFSIEIYDTTLPAWEQVPLEFAEAATINLSWAGSDSKMQLIKASVLDFTMEVNMAPPPEDTVGYTTDAWFSKLFTGNETKFAVFIKDEDTNQTIWHGFLLPEQYREPYTQGTFYVTFTATDGLARLRGKELPDGMYRGRSSMAHIIANCLKLTGLYKQIWVAQAIENAGQGGAYKHIDKWFYSLAENETKGRKKDAYAILEDVLTLMGCTLFQQDDRWYVVGWNQFYKSSIQFDIYNPEGVRYSSTLGRKRPARILQFEATPDVSIKAPFKTVEINSPFEQDLKLYPEDVVLQNYVLYDKNQVLLHPKYWRAVNLNLPYFLVPIEVNNNVFTDIEESDEPIKSTSYVSILKNVNQTTNSFTGWVEFGYPIFLKSGMKLKLAFELLLRGATANNLNNNNIKFDIRINDTVLYSNRSLGVNVLLAFSDETTDRPDQVAQTAKLEIEELTIPLEGFLTIRFYPIQDFFLVAQLSVKKLEVALIDPEKENVFKTRAIDFVTQTEFAPEVKDTVLINTKNIVVDKKRADYVLQNVWLQSSPTLKPLAPGSALKYEFSQALGIPLANVSNVQTNIQKLFLIRKDSDFFENLPAAKMYTAAHWPFGYLYLNTFDDYKLQAGDRLYINSGVTTPVFNATATGSREQWKKTEADTGTKRLHECLAEVVHDIHPRELIQLEGNVEGLIFPLDQMKFYYKNNLRSLMALRIDITMDRGVTKLTAIEDITQKVEDYV
jgi:hypothetical protein